MWEGQGGYHCTSTTLLSVYPSVPPNRSPLYTVGKVGKGEETTHVQISVQSKYIVPYCVSPRQFDSEVIENKYKSLSTNFMILLTL